MSKMLTRASFAIVGTALLFVALLLKGIFQVAGWLTCHALPGLWRWRTELAITAGSLFTAYTIANVFGPEALFVLFIVAAVALLCASQAHEMTGRATRTLAGLGGPLDRILTRARWRRRWPKAQRDAGAIKPGTRDSPKVSRVARVERTPAGHRLEVRLPSGMSAETLDHCREGLRSALDAHAIRIAPNRTRGRHATVHVAYRDPLAATDAIPWPHAHESYMSVWDAVDLGVDEYGAPVTLSLFSEGHGAHSLLTGGLPGFGKTSLVNLLLSHIALDPTVDLFIVDGKPAALGSFRARATAYAGDPTLDTREQERQAVEILGRAREWMRERYAQLDRDSDRESGDSARPGDPVAVVVCDELATFVTESKRGGQGKVGDLLTDLVRRGRQVGLAVVVTTQKPTINAIPSQLRSNVDTRLAFQTMDRPASDSILGDGWSNQGFDASRLPRIPGLGLLHTGALEPARVKTYFMDPKLAREIAERTATPKDGDSPSFPAEPVSTVATPDTDGADGANDAPAGVPYGDGPSGAGGLHQMHQTETGDGEKTAESPAADQPRFEREELRAPGELSTKEKRPHVERAMRMNPKRGDRELGREWMVPHTTVMRWREKMRERGEL